MVKPEEHDCRDSAVVRRATAENPYHYTESGLPNVYLAGIRYYVCQQCGTQSAEIHAVKRLHMALARLIVENEARLTGADIRFLRKRLGKSAIDFAKIVGVTPEQVSRWENDSNAPEKSADKFIRLYYAVLSGDKELRHKIGPRDADEELDAWLANLPTDEQLERIRAVLNRKHEWDVEPVAV